MEDGENVAEEEEDQQAGRSMIEQLPTDMITEVFSYLDHASLCRLSMTNSLMGQAANDDYVWKVLYRRDFNMVQQIANGWKASYAATKAIMDVNARFYNIIRERSLEAIGDLWRNANWVECIHGHERFTGYFEVIDRWESLFKREIKVHIQNVNVYAHAEGFQVVTMAAYRDGNGPFYASNVYQFHDGEWFIVRNCSAIFSSAIFN